MEGLTAQLAAKGHDSKFLIKDPEITLFKAVYRRHINFINFPIKRYFKPDPTFSKKSYINLSREADLLKQLYLYVELPEIHLNDAKFAWVDYIGFSMIRRFEFIINGDVIESVDGEWLKNYAFANKESTDNLEKMVGHVPELLDFTYKKNPTELIIPLNPFFSKSNNLAFPLVAASSSEIEVAIELNSIEHCIKLSPTNYIPCVKSIVAFEKGELLKQLDENDEKIFGYFESYDLSNSRLYYRAITESKFKGLETESANPTESEINELLNDESNSFNKIVGISSGETVFPQVNKVSKNNPIRDRISTIKLREGYLIGEFILVDREERERMMSTTLDYVIEQVYRSEDIRVAGTTTSININSLSPSKYMLWRPILKYNRDVSKDYYNYSSNPNNDWNNKIIEKESLEYDGLERISNRDDEFFTQIQPLKYLKNIPTKHSHFYSFSLEPLKAQPTGTSNFSEIKKVELKLTLSNDITNKNPAFIKYYVVVINILRVSKGVAGLIFNALNVNS
jgi:hypothetical protein